jgi:hypothetical protein
MLAYFATDLLFNGHSLSNSVAKPVLEDGGSCGLDLTNSTLNLTCD